MQRLEKLLLSGFLATTLVCNAQKTVVLDDVEVVQTRVAKATTYTSPNQTWDVQHIDLELKPDWTKHALLGKADVYVRPYFYAADTVVLDAKGFKLHQVALVEGGLKRNLTYRYDGMQLHIAMGRQVPRTETLHLFIDYTALPDSLQIKGGQAIRDAKGFYFIDRAEGKMQQFWTQGEPESNSSWFPTVDKPFEKITHRIGITVPADWQTLSNGHLEFRTENGDGTRTDYWHMDQPHAPYLTMLGGGKFDTVGTRWQGKPVRYFVEPEWKSSAQRIFGNTPEMLSYFSDLLGVPYPWDKYDQIVVRDYVSGAMENTTATVHGEFLYADPRAFADETNEDVISHELFHQWFGDLVTCESWAQLPLNESFATYGEVLWKEYKYGADDAAFHRENDRDRYLDEFTWGKQEKMIRLNNAEPLEMFDSHSYAKGGRLLHMLRGTVGDEAFFAALKKYLTDNAFGTAEIEDLRQAFEATTGRDLRWFFDQWFYHPGHPQLIVKPSFNKEEGVAKLSIKQGQDFTRFPVYRLPVAVDVYFNKTVKRYWVEVDAQEQEFKFPAEAQPMLIKFDAENYLLAEVTTEQPDAAWLYQLGNSKQALDRYAAAEHLLESKNLNLVSTVAGIAMDDKYHEVRLLGLESAGRWDEAGKKKLESTVEKLLNDPKPAVRAEALRVWAVIYKKNDEKLYSKNLEFTSKQVNSAALQGLAMANPQRALQFVTDSLTTTKGRWQEACLPVVAEFGTAADVAAADAFVAAQGGYEAIAWYYYLAQHFGRGGDVGKTMVDILAVKAASAPLQPTGYYALRFLTDSTAELEEKAKISAPEVAKTQREMAKYAREKLETLPQQQ